MTDRDIAIVFGISLVLTFGLTLGVGWYWLKRKK